MGNKDPGVPSEAQALSFALTEAAARIARQHQTSRILPQLQNQLCCLTEMKSGKDISGSCGGLQSTLYVNI